MNRQTMQAVLFKNTDIAGLADTVEHADIDWSAWQISKDPVRGGASYDVQDALLIGAELQVSHIDYRIAA